VQVLRPEERVILKDSDIGVILCLDEYKTALQARNAVCPGFSTIIENLFHSIESISDEDLAFVNIGECLLIDCGWGLVVVMHT